MLYNDSNLPIKSGNTVYKDFGACVAAQRKKGKSPESAKKICGFLQARTEGKAVNASQVPPGFRPHVNRSIKALDFLRQQGVLNEDDNNNNDTSLDNQSQLSGMSDNNVIFSDPESYTDKITRIMDEYSVSEEEARAIVNTLIADDMAELDRRELEVLKKAQIEQTEADMMTSDDNGQQQQPVAEEESQQEEGNVGTESTTTAEYQQQ